MLNIKEMLSIATDKQKPLLLEAIKNFEEETSQLPRTDEKTLNNSINTEYRELAVKYQKIFKNIMDQRE